jgi:DNA-binding winged helix-turn-helix (wHTH) protein/tetratricopeptide (TPR) repeat protein
VIYSFNNIEIDSALYRLYVDGVETAIEPQVFDVLVYLIQNRDTVVSRHQLLEHVWKDRVVSDSSINNYIKTARKIVGDDARKQSIIKTIHSRGYQFVADLNQSLKPNQRLNRNKQPLMGSIKWLLLITSVCLLTLYLWTQQDQSESSGALSDMHRIAVLPFINNQPHSDTDYLGFALADEVIGQLNYIKNVTVRPSSSMRKYINTQDQLMDIGQELDVEFVLSGHYTQVNQDIRLNLELVDIRLNQIKWRSDPIQTSYGNTHQLQEVVVRQVVEGLKLEFSEQKKAGIHKDTPSDPLAYEYYLRSLSYPYDAEGHRLAIAMLQQSLAVDDRFAPTYIQLGNRVRRLAQFGEVESVPILNTEQYYLKALSLNPDLLEAMAFLSMYYTETNRIDEALELARYMHQINPNNANSHFVLGYIYRYAGMMDEALAEMEKAVDLDPKNIKFRSLIGSYSATGQYQKALEMTSLYDPSPFTLGWQALMHMQLGNTEQSLLMFDQIIQTYPNSLWSNVAVIHQSYLTGQPKEGIDAVESLVNTHVMDGETIYYTAAYYGLLGEEELSIELLKHAIASGYFNYRNMLNNDYFEPFNDTEPFLQVVKEAQRKHDVFLKKHFPEFH